MLGDVEGSCSEYFLLYKSKLKTLKLHVTMKVQTSPENFYIYDPPQYFVSTVQQLKHYLSAPIVSSSSVYSAAGPH